MSIDTSDKNTKSNTHFWESWSIQTRLMILVLISLLPALGIILHTGFEEQKKDIENAKTNVLRSVENLASLQVTITASAKQMLMTIARYPGVQNGDVDACNNFFADLLRHPPSHGIIIAAAGIDGMVFAAGKANTPYSIADRKYFQDALATRDFAVGEYSISRSIHVPVLHFVLPVINDQDQLNGFVLAALRLDQYENYFHKMGYPEDSVVGIEDRNGNRLYRFPKLDGEMSEVTGQPLQPKIWQSISGPLKKGTYIEKGVDGISRIYGFIQLRIKEEDKPYLYIRVGIPEEYAISSATRKLSHNLLLLSIATCFALAFAWLLGNLTLVNPIKHLVGVSHQMGAGNFDIRSGISHMKGGEIGRLAQSFDMMASALKAREIERQQSEEAIQQLCLQNQLILNAAGEGILGLDDHGKVIFMNPAAAEITGYEASELLGEDLHQRIHHSMPDGTAYPRDLCPMCETLIKGTARRIRDEVLWHKDGTSFPSAYSTTPIFKNGKLSGAVITFRNISERKRLEEEKDQMKLQMFQSQKMESIGMLAGGVAHDFNNMLSVIICRVEMELDQLASTNPLYSNLQDIHNAAKRSADLTKQLLAFARKQTISPKVLDLNDAVSNILNMLKRLIGEDINLTWIPGPNLWPIVLDPTQIDQIMANLAVNARDAIGGVGAITIETTNVVIDETYSQNHMSFPAGSFALLTVSDNGKGMDKATLSHIFEPFFTTKEMGKGTGLGLSTVYGIVKQNNGFIYVYSEPGQGTAFKIYLPRTDSPIMEESVQSERKALLGTETVLLVEDEESILDLAREILEQYGYTVLAALTPDIAFVLAKNHPGCIHLLLTDVIMPGMNGKDLNEAIKPIRPGLKSIFMSGYTPDIVAHNGVLDEGIHFLQKPFSPKTLAEKIRDVLET